MQFDISRRGLLAASAATGFVAATGMAKAAAPKQGGKIRVGMGHGSTSDSLDPATWTTGLDKAIAYGLHNYLAEVDANGALQPEVATSWEASNGAKTWRFELRQGMKFHDGSDLTSEDVLASINHHRGDDSTSGGKTVVADVVDLKADGQYAVVFELASGSADFPFLLTDYHLPILKSDGGKLTDFETGLGGYRLVSYEPGVRSSFKRNEDYWKEGRAHFDEAEILCLVDATARTNAMLSGQVDVIDRVDPKVAALFERAPGVSLKSVAGNQHYAFPMDARLDPYTQNQLRQALKFSVRRDELVQKILGGYGSVGNDHPIGSRQRFYNTELAQTSYDLDRAKWHMKQAGLDNINLELQTADAAFGGAIDASQLIANSASPAGINIDVKRVPNDGYWSNVWTKVPFSASYWTGRPTEDQMFTTTYYSGGPWNESHWSNERFDALLVMARAELDTEKRKAMYWEMQEIVNTDGATVIPMFANYLFAMNDKIGHGELASNLDVDGQRWMERWWMA